MECPNISREAKRLIPVQWAIDVDDHMYDVRLTIYSDDRTYLLSDIITIVQQYNATLKHVDSGIDSNSLTATTHLDLSVRNAEHLRMIMVNLKKIRSIHSVERVTK
jgi:GTP pyrophosphokinase